MEMFYIIQKLNLVWIYERFLFARYRCCNFIIFVDVGIPYNISVAAINMDGVGEFSYTIAFSKELGMFDSFILHMITKLTHGYFEQRYL